MKTARCIGLAAALMIGSVARRQGIPAAQADSPASAQPSAAAVELMRRVDAAYAGLQSGELDGHLTLHIDRLGEQKDTDHGFTSFFRSPNRLRQIGNDGDLVGSTGETFFAYDRGKSLYMQDDAPKARVNGSAWPQYFMLNLQTQNPSLLLAVTASAARDLNDISPNVQRAADTSLDGTAFPTLRFEMKNGEIITMLFDPRTSLLRRASYDATQTGGKDVKAYTWVVDYTKTNVSTSAGAAPRRDISHHVAAGSVNRKVHPPPAADWKVTWL